jgi:methylenetetrahydrofolate dehydrogenase (NADP+) / methenyltetrahydrofolate cyclohydrolase
MTAHVIDGRALAKRVRANCRVQVEHLNAHGIRPGLAVVLVGENASSQIYVSNKARACAEVGVQSRIIELPESVSEAELLSELQALNEDPAVHGILVQLPLPKGMDVRKVIESIARTKDVDGFHLYNVGALAVGASIFPPCTPYGVQLLLESEGIEVEGKNVVVVGASNIVGKPMALMLMQKDATVTVCHAKTRDLAQFTILADVLIVAAGRPNLITGPMVKCGAVVIDVGINRLDDGSITGDVEFEAVARKASYITPVPVGVGPMTVTMLIVNTLRSAQLEAARAGLIEHPNLDAVSWDPLFAA